MKQLASMHQNQTMTSKEIASLSNRTHSSVLRSIDTLVQSLSDADLHRGYESTTYVDSNGQEQRMYRMDKNSTLCLVTGYDAVARMRIIERWQELEQQNRPLSYKEALYALIEAEERRERDMLVMLQQAEVIDHKKIITGEGEDYFPVSVISDNTGISYSGRRLNKMSDELGIPAIPMFASKGQNQVKAYHWSVWEAAYPDVILPE